MTRAFYAIRSFYAILAGSAILIAGLFLVPEPMTAALVKENGVIETASALFYLAGAGIVVWGAGASRASWTSIRLSAFVLLLAFGLRELDFHHWFTSESVFGLRLYLSGDAPVSEILIGLAILVPILSACAVLGMAALRNMKKLLQALKNTATPVSHAGAGVLALFASIPFDKKLVSETLISYQGQTIMEESLELAASAFFLSACVFWVWGAKGA